MAWTVERGGPVCTKVRIEFEKSPEWEQWFLVSADRHIDNPKSDIALQKFHLEQAKERDAGVMDFGDFFDAMQGKTDKRSSKRDLLARFAALHLDPEDDQTSYLNALVDYGAEFLAPYIKQFVVIGEGNHESSVANKLEYNLLDGLFREINRMGGTQVCKGGYRGWVKFQFQDKKGGMRIGRRAYYHHGSGGGGPVTKGVIQTNRRAVYLPDADYVFTGHIHEQWNLKIPRVRLLESGREVADVQHHVQLPTYKEEYLNTGGGFHHEKGGPPKPIGAWWMRFYWSTRSQEVKVQFTEAET